MKKISLIISVITFYGCSQNESKNKDITSLVTAEVISYEVKEEIIKDDLCGISDTLEVLFGGLKESNVDIALTNILGIVLSNKKAFSNECVMLTLEDWFTEKANYSFIELIKKKDMSDESFNGFEYLDKYSVVFKNNSELSEAISEELALLTIENPDKFINYIESLETKEEREFVLSRPFWNESIYQSIQEQIEKSKYKDEITGFLKNSG
jgi:hypothetical protein